MSREIREVQGEEAVDTARVLMNYAFGSGPPSAATLARWRTEQAESTGPVDDSRVLVAFEDGRAVATATGHRFRQNVRGRVLPALGIGGVTTHPDYRRGGHVRALLGALHRRAIDDGDLVSALYPFRAGFYARFGYAGLPIRRSVELHPAGMDELRRLTLDATVSLHRSDDPQAWQAYLGVEDAWLRDRHGMMLETSLERRRAAGPGANCYVALVHDAGEVTGAMLFTTVRFGGDLRANRFFAASARARTALLRWLSGHGNQYGTFCLPLPPGTVPELWFTEVDCRDVTETSVPEHGAPMARLLHVDALTGLDVGPARTVVRVTGDDLIDGTWILDGTAGSLEVRRSDEEPAATLTMPGLSALVYGVAGPQDLAARDQGTFSPAGADALSTLFGRLAPYLVEEF